MQMSLLCTQYRIIAPCAVSGSFRANAAECWSGDQATSCPFRPARERLLPTGNWELDSVLATGCVESGSEAARCPGGICWACRRCSDESSDSDPKPSVPEEWVCALPLRALPARLRDGRDVYVGVDYYSRAVEALMASALGACGKPRPETRRAVLLGGDPYSVSARRYQAFP